MIEWMVTDYKGGLVTDKFRDELVERVRLAEKAVAVARARVAGGRHRGLPPEVQQVNIDWVNVSEAVLGEQLRRLNEKVTADHWKAGNR